jgi:hypothetical protein
MSACGKARDSRVVGLSSLLVVCLGCSDMDRRETSHARAAVCGAAVMYVSERVRRGVYESMSVSGVSEMGRFVDGVHRAVSAIGGLMKRFFRVDLSVSVSGGRIGTRDWEGMLCASASGR